jgi:hypothetical protein
MILQHPVRRRILRDLARIATACAALMFAVTVWISLEGGRAPAFAAVTGGTAGVFATTGSGALTAGGSSTQFVVKPPDGSKCTGDSANGGYKVNSYMVPSTVDVSTLTFNNNGPILPSGSPATFAQPLYKAGSLNKVTNLQTGPGDGLVIGITPVTFEIYSAASPTPTGSLALPAGTYNVGIVCALTTAQPYSLDKFWNVQFTVVADPTDVPGGFKWTVLDAAVTTTTSSTSSTTTTSSTSSTTTTTAACTGSTTTTTACTGSTTTTTGSTTTTTHGAGVTSTSTDSGVLGSSASPLSGTPLVSASLPRTGASTTALVFWAVLLLVFGRMAILLGRTPTVIPVTG